MTSVWTGYRFEVAGALPSARLANFEDPGPFGGDAAATGLGKHAPGRLVQRLFRQIERAPVNAKQGARFEIDGGLDGFLRGKMHRFHDLRRLIGADGDGRHVKRPQSFADVFEASEIAGVAAEVKTPGFGHYGPGRPEPSVTVPQCPLGEVLRRYANKP